MTILNFRVFVSNQFGSQNFERKQFCGTVIILKIYDEIGANLFFTPNTSSEEKSGVNAENRSSKVPSPDLKNQEG